MHAFLNPSQDGVTALMIAIHFSSSTVMEVLLSTKPNVNMITYIEVYASTLYSFSAYNLLPMVQQNGTALTFACQKEDTFGVHSLLQLGADPNQCTKVLHSTLLILIVLGICAHY